MLTMNDLREMHKKQKSEKRRLVDIQDVQAIPSEPYAAYVERYFTAIGNPYHFRCGDVPVVVRFSSQGETLSEKLERHLIRQKG